MNRFVLAAIAALVVSGEVAAQGCYGGGGATYGAPAFRFQRNGMVFEAYEVGPRAGSYGGYSNGYAGEVEALPMPGVREYREPYYDVDQAVRFRRSPAPRYYQAPAYYAAAPRRPLFRASAEVNIGRRGYCPICP